MINDTQVAAAPCSSTEDAYLRMSCLQQANASREVERGDDPVMVAQRYYDFVTGAAPAVDS